jgi:hypothetical protein
MKENKAFSGRALTVMLKPVNLKIILEMIPFLRTQLRREMDSGKREGWVLSR